MFDWARRHAFGLLAAAAAAVGVATFGSLAAVVLFGVTTLLGGGSVVAAVLPFLLAALAFGALEVALLVGLVWVGFRRAASAVRLPRDERLARPVRRLEARSDAVAALGLGDRLEPDPAERRERLRERYVNGEIDEIEFERRLERLVADEEEAFAVTSDGGRGRDERSPAAPAASDDRGSTAPTGTDASHTASEATPAAAADETDTNGATDANRRTDASDVAETDESDDAGDTDEREPV